MALTILTGTNSFTLNDQICGRGDVAFSKTQDGVTWRIKGTGLTGTEKLEDITIDGSTPADLDALYSSLNDNCFKPGGGTGEGVQAVTGDLVDNTDPKNPVINNPTWDQVEPKPATFPPIIGTTADTAMAGNTPIPIIPEVIPQAEAEAGVATTQRTISAQRLAQAIAALAPTEGTVQGSVSPMIYEESTKTIAIGVPNESSGNFLQVVLGPGGTEWVAGWSEYALPLTLGTPGQVLAVNAAGDGVEWVTPA